jgi:hypothetical protein
MPQDTDRYDFFVSYAIRDNFDGWISAFVDGLLAEHGAGNPVHEYLGELSLQRALLDELGIRPRRIVIAVKPFMQRRIWATLAVVWSEVSATLVSPRMSLDEYFTPELDAAKIFNIMMGDLQRIWVYGRKGWSAPQAILENVQAAFRRLAELGFTKHLISEE